MCSNHEIAVAAYATKTASCSTYVPKSKIPVEVGLESIWAFILLDLVSKA